MAAVGAPPRAMCGGLATGARSRPAPYTPAMTDLFADAAATHESQTAPLPQRIRPRSLDELVGQRHVLAEGSALRLAIEADRPPSMILYGPPGVGKTTLARIVAETTGAAFEELSAVSARVDDVRGVLQRARDRLGANGTRTILFLDEIHRFNKAQQDALLPGVESGLLTLIGATTENPYFEVNAALLSRCAVVELESLSDDEVAAVVGRGAAELGIDGRRRTSSRRSCARPAATPAARSATLELSWQTAAAEGAPLEARHVADAARKRPLRYDRDGDQHYDIISAFIKSMRGSDPDAAVYYLAAMLEGGEDARFIARRMVILASEDIGNADPRALLVAVAAAQALEHVGLPEAQLNLAQAAIYLAQRAEVERLGDGRSGTRASEVRERGIQAPPAALRDAHYAGRAHARPRRGLRLAARRPGRRRRPTTSPTASRAGPTMFPPATERRAAMAIGTGEQAPEFDLEEAYDKPRLRLADFRGKRNVLLVFHPFAFTAVCREEALDLQANLESFDNAETDVIFVSCDTSAARQAWKQELGATLRVRLRLLAARRRRARLRRLRRGDRRAPCAARS